jgi:hypothetical protein
MQQRNGRRGDVFSVRLTPEQRATLDELQRRGGGPRKLGPWLVWRALASADGIAPRLAQPIHEAASGSTRSSTVHVSQRLILDLCAGSGSWSEPYTAAGYPVLRVTLPEHDVRTFVPPARPVWGILAAPPCDQFSLARNAQKSPRDFRRGMACVNACMRIIGQCSPRWWALENPVGMLSKWLGTPRDTFEPCDFGDPWTKRTALWGDFTVPVRGPYVEPLGGGPLCTVCDPALRKTVWCNNRHHRAVTPAGFARAFFEANP